MSEKKVVKAKSVKLTGTFQQFGPRMPCGSSDLEVECGACGKSFEAKGVPVVPNVERDCPHCLAANKLR